MANNVLQLGLARLQCESLGRNIILYDDINLLPRHLALVADFFLIADGVLNGLEQREGLLERKDLSCHDTITSKSFQ